MMIRVMREKVSKVIMINESAEVLILKRAYKSERSPWEWDLPGGHVDALETYQQAAQREVYEETGFVTRSLMHHSIGRNFGKTTAFYICTEWLGAPKGKAGQSHEVPRLSDEHTKSLWVDKQRLLEYKESIGLFYYEKIIEALEFFNDARQKRTQP